MINEKFLKDSPKKIELSVKRAEIAKLIDELEIMKMLQEQESMQRGVVNG